MAFLGSQQAIANVLREYGVQSADQLPEPVRSFVLDTGNTLFPGAFGVPDFRDNVFNREIQSRLQQANAELENVVTKAGTSSTFSSANLSKSVDWRARLRPKDGGAEQFYSQLGATDYLLKPIKDSGGLIWQYTPTLYISGSANYDQAESQGSNYPINTFRNSRGPDIPVTSEFTANDIYEARYLLAVMTFLKVATKAYYGDTAVASGRYGTPPPVLLFEYLGDHGFNKVPVVVTNYTIELPPDVDYVPVETGIGGEGGEVTYVPTNTNITVNLTPTYTPHKLRKRFDLESLANGRAYKDGFI